MVLANAAPDDARRGWDELRAESLRRFDAFEATATARGERLANVALGLDATPLVAVPPMAVGGALSRVRAEGRAALVVRTESLDALHDPPVWWTRLRSALPAPAPAEGRLPAFTPWVEALRPHVAALPTWDEAEAIQADIRAQVGPPPPELSAADPRRAAVLRPTPSGSKTSTWAPSAWRRHRCCSPSPDVSGLKLRSVSRLVNWDSMSLAALTSRTVSASSVGRSGVAPCSAQRRCTIWPPTSVQ